MQAQLSDEHATSELTPAESLPFTVGVTGTGLLYNTLDVACFGHKFELVTYRHDVETPSSWTMRAYCACGYTAMRDRCTNCGYKFPTAQVSWGSEMPGVETFSDWLAPIIEACTGQNHLQASLTALAVEDFIGEIARRLAPDCLIVFDPETRERVSQVPAVREDWTALGAELLGKKS